jgi:cytochrome c5
MSKENHEGSASNESFIKSPKQLIVVCVLAFLVPIILILLLANLTAGEKRGKEADVKTVAARIAPAGSLKEFNPAETHIAPAPAAPPAGAKPRSGEEMVKGVCGACHASGAAGAPKIGDKAAWGPRLGAGLNSLLASALNGKGAMGPQKTSGSEAEVKAAVEYMIAQAK